jgi:hypothetical protein
VPSEQGYDSITSQVGKYKKGEFMKKNLILSLSCIIALSSVTTVLAIDKGKSASGGSKAAVSAKDAKVSVAKATGANAYTVQEIFANSAKLNKMKVVVRGKVVKVSAGIMGKNWIHIQDGTGTQANKNHNLVCTSQDMADVDDVVTVSGVLAKDKDFGGGYKYSAIVEDATIKK